MSVIEGLIRAGENGSLDFGNYMLDAKSKVSDFEHLGDSYKVKTYKDITKLERNDLFVYESVPGTRVDGFSVGEQTVEFSVEGFEDTQIALGLEPEQEYQIYIDEVSTGNAKTNLGGKLVISVELGDGVKKIKTVKL